MGDLYCSKAQPIIKINAKSTMAKAINIIMIGESLIQLLVIDVELSVSSEYLGDCMREESHTINLFNSAIFSGLLIIRL